MKTVPAIDRRAALPPLARRTRAAAALAGALASSVLLGSVVLGFTGMAEPLSSASAAAPNGCASDVNA